MNKFKAGLIANTPIFLFTLVSLWHPEFKIVPKDDLSNLIFGAVFGVLVFPISLFICNSKMDISINLYQEVKSAFFIYFLRCTIITAFVEEYIWRYVVFEGLLIFKINSFYAFICSVFFFMLFI